MSCTHIQELLPEYSLGLLTPEEAAEVEQHLSAGCYDCQAILDELHEAAAMIPLTDSTASQRIAPPADLKDSLMQRVLGDNERHDSQLESTVGEPHFTSRVRKRSTWKYLLGYATAAAVAFVIGMQFTGGPEPVVLTQAKRERLYQERMAQIQQSFDAGSIRLATATRSANQPDKQGAVVWDAQAREVHLFAFAIPSPAENRTLQAWLVNADGDYLPIGSLKVDERGDVAQAFAAPKDVDSVASVVVTEELKPATARIPAGGSPAGEVRLIAPFE